MILRVKILPTHWDCSQEFVSSLFHRVEIVDEVVEPEHGVWGDHNLYSGVHTPYPHAEAGLAQLNLPYDHPKY